MVPKTCPVFSLSEDAWEKKMCRKGEHQTGWKCGSASISFSMSSQLWFHFHSDSIEEYKLATVEVDTSRPTMSYSDLLAGKGV